MRVRKPPRSLTTAPSRVVSTSLLYGTQTAYTLSYAPSAPTRPVYDPDKGGYRWPEPRGVSVTFEVFLEQGSRNSPTEQPGLEEGETLLDGRVVRTPDGTPLEFPAEVKAGTTFDLTLFGTKGTLKLLPTPDAQGPAERAVRGRTFQAAFRAVG